MDELKLSDWLTIAAIIIGPLAAVMITLGFEQWRQLRQRRMDLFRTLMRTRRTPIHPDHVGALNLVEIEFAGVQSIQTPYKALINHFGAAHSRLPQEEPRDTDTVEQRNKKEDRFNERLAQERAELLATLLHAIAKKLGFKIEQLEIFKGGYTPEGHQILELEQSIIRRFLVDLYFGRRFLPVWVAEAETGRQENGEGAGPTNPT